MDLADFASVERLTCQAFFAPAGGTPVNLGNGVEMVRLDYGLKTVDIIGSRRGVLSPRQRVVYGRAPVWSLQHHQITTPAQALQLAGTRVADVTQDATTGDTYTFTAAPGGAYSLGKVAIARCDVTVGGELKLLGFDYSLDDFNGWLWLPVTGGSIAPGDVVLATFDYAAMALETYTAFDTLSVKGTLTVYLEDEYGPPAREGWAMSVTIYAKQLPDTDPTKFRSYALEAMIYGKPQVVKRKEAFGFSTEIISDTGAVLDLSP